MTAQASTPPASGETAHHSGELEEERRSVVLPLMAIVVAIALPFGLAVLAGAGGGIAVTIAGVVAMAGVLYVLTVAMVRIMGDGP